MKPRSHLLTLLTCLTWSLFQAVSPSPSQAGLGPENVIVVVNSQSEDSQSIARHYVNLRQIPASNVVSLPWDPAKDVTNVDAFRDHILSPIFEAIAKRGLTQQIQCIAYSSDFPWRIDVSADVKNLDARSPIRRNSKFYRPHCSINALTYHFQAVLKRDPAGYLSLASNRYALPIPRPNQTSVSKRFDYSLEFDNQGLPVTEGKRSYLLCTMLAVTAGRGNTLPEVLHYLKRSAQADGTQPTGTIYFLQNSNIRSETRHRLFRQAIRELRDLGIHGSLVDGILPQKKTDVMGAMIGTASFNWAESESTILPGAICEHLTSYGGVMTKSAGQTPLTEFLRHGAAGASGTVTEPYAIAAKFPSPSIHCHYGRGCTLAEAFYQSVSGPFHLLIVGDPLCAPWAVIPKVSLTGLPMNPAHGILTLIPQATVPGGGSIHHYELFLDGILKEEIKPGTAITIDTTQLTNGPHELRVVAIEKSPIRSRGRMITQIVVQNP